jgi:hypothetical protein
MDVEEQKEKEKPSATIALRSTRMYGKSIGGRFGRSPNSGISLEPD